MYLGSLWSAVNWCLSWLVPVVHHVTDVLTGWLVIPGSGLKPFVLSYRVPLWCFTFPCGIHVYGCPLFSILYSFTFTSSVFSSKLFLCFFTIVWFFAKRTFFSFDRQLFSWEMATMTLCLCNQLNLHRSQREHRQMLTLHFSADSICTGSTSARLFCLPNTRITSHLFIYEGANQLHHEGRAAGCPVDLTDKICPPRCHTVLTDV